MFQALLTLSAVPITELKLLAEILKVTFKGRCLPDTDKLYQVLTIDEKKSLTFLLAGLGYTLTSHSLIPPKYCDITLCSAYAAVFGLYVCVLIGRDAPKGFCAGCCTIL